MKYACNSTLYSLPPFHWSKAVQMAVSQHLAAIVLKLLTNELFYCLFPSLCTDGRILSTSFYCYWIDSGLCMHCVRVLRFFLRGLGGSFYFLMGSLLGNISICFRKKRIFNEVTFAQR